MSRKLFLLLVAIFGMVYIVKAQEGETVEEGNIAETEEVAPGNKAEEKAEIKEINAEEKAKEAEADADIKDEGQKEVAKEEAEDKAAGKEEAEIEAAEAKQEAEKEATEEPKIAEKKEESGSWLSWLWPFSSSKKAEAPKEEAAAVEEKPAEAPAPAEEEKPAEVAAPAEVEKPAEEAAPAEAKVQEIKPVDEEPKVTEQKKEGSWFSWLWPFSSGKKAEKDAVVADKAPEGEAVVEVAVAEDAKGDVAEEAVVVAEAPAAVAAPVQEAAPAEPKVDEKAGEKEGGSFTRAALLYIPNIFLNLSDIISAGISAGAEAGAEVHLTRYCQIGGQYGDSYFVEKGFDRRFGGGYDNGYSFGLVALSSEKRYVDKTFGSVEEFILKDSKARIFSPDDPIYMTQKRDFWAIGVDAGWLINVRVDFHPIEFADFFASLIAMDITGDNLK